MVVEDPGKADQESGVGAPGLTVEEIDYLALTAKLELELATVGLVLAQPYDGTLGSLTFLEERGIPRISGIPGRSVDDEWLRYVFVLESPLVPGLTAGEAMLDFQYAAEHFGYYPVGSLTYVNEYGNALSVNLVTKADTMLFDLVLASRPLAPNARGETREQQDNARRAMTERTSAFFTKVEETMRTNGSCQSIDGIYPLSSLLCR